MRYIEIFLAKYEMLPVKLRLFLGMLVASNTAALAIFLSIYFTKYQHDYQTCLGVFLAYRVCAFMANKGMMLNDENVAIMSSERTKWNSATIAILAVMIPVLLLISHLTK